MGDYQRVKGKYILPRTVYNQTIWIIRDYERMCDELNDILLSSPAPPDGMPRGSGNSNEVAAKVEKREKLLGTTLVIESCLKRIPGEYREGVWRNIQCKSPFPLDANRSTYVRHKSKFICEVAKKLKII